MTSTVDPTASAAVVGATPAPPKTVLGSDLNTFLKILTTQLQHQDPLSPLDTNQFTQQLVSFSQVEQAINVNAKLATLISLQSANQAVSALPLVGRTVEIDGASTALADGAARFSYTLPSAATSSFLTITDAAGQPVWQGQGETAQGRHEFSWDGKLADGSTAPEGIYTLNVSAGGADGKPVTASVTAYGKVGGIEMKDGAAQMMIGALDVPVTKMIAVRDGI